MRATNMELKRWPQNEKEHHLPNHHFWVPAFSVGGPSYLKKWSEISEI